jgi:hypothetical protein
MMRQVPVSPERLRNAQENAQRGGEQAVHPGRSKEGAMDEIVSDRVRVPPHAEGDDRRERPDCQHRTVQRGERPPE